MGLKFTKKKVNIENKTSFIKSKKIKINKNAVKITYISNDIDNFNIKPKYSYVYNGVPGGWYI